MQKDLGLSPRELVESILKSRHPATVQELARLVMTEITIDDDDFIAVIKEMVRDGSLSLGEPVREIESVWDYLLATSLSMWLLTAVSATILALIAILVIPDSFPVVIARWLCGAMLVLFLPGYAMLELLFPKQSEMDSLERFIFSVGLSLALVPLVGLVLYYTPWGVQLVPVTVSISVLTIAFLVAAADRKYADVRKHGVAVDAEYNS
jgi:uncharacterized membrane protein